MNCKIIVATHKKSPMPSDSLYLPLQVGAVNGESLGYCGDDKGDNISDKNPIFCELTGLYWVWKNCEYDYVGLVHYRRFFSFDGKHVLSTDKACDLLTSHEIIVPKKRKYYIESLYSHYAHTFDGSHLDVSRAIIREKYPKYVSVFDEVMKRRSGYMFNMMIMSRARMNEYCAWLFDVLFELERRVDVTGYTAFERRFCGRVSELLFNVWLAYQLREGSISPNDICEVKCLCTQKVDWLRKGSAFLKAKFLGKKYTGSF